MLKKNPKKKHGNSKGTWRSKRIQHRHPSPLKKNKEWRSSRQVKTNMETPKKFYLEYSWGPNVSTFVFHPNAGPNVSSRLARWIRTQLTGHSHGAPRGFTYIRV